MAPLDDVVPIDGVHVFLHEIIDDFTVLLANLPLPPHLVGEDGVVHEVLGHAPEVGGHVDGEVDVAVVASVIGVDGPKGGVVALPTGDLVLVGVAGDIAVLGPEHGLLAGGVDVLAVSDGAPGANGKKGPEGTLERGHLGGEFIGGTHGRGEVVAVGEDDARAGLGDEVTTEVARMRACLSEGGDGDVDEAGVHGFEVFISEAEARQIAGGEVFHEDVRAFGEGSNLGAVFGNVDVQDDAAFGAVGMDEAKASLRVLDVAREGGHVARRIAAGRLYFDDVSAKVAEGAGAVLREVAGQV